MPWILTTEMDSSAENNTNAYGVLACCGNALVLLIVWKYKTLRTTTNIFITNLALADLGISVFGFPFSASSNFAGRLNGIKNGYINNITILLQARIFSEKTVQEEWKTANNKVPLTKGRRQKWISGRISCQLYAFNGMMFGIGSIGFLAAISVDRYLMTCKHRSFLEMKPSHYGWASVMVWINAVFWATGPLLGWGCYDTGPSGAACGLSWQCDWVIHATYTLCVFVLCFVIPGIVIVYCYTKTYKFLSFLGGGGRHDSIEWTHQKEVTRMCAVAILLFIVAWTPYATVFLWATFGNPSDIPILIKASPPLFAKSSAFYNPLIYALMNNRFRIAIKRLFKCGGKFSDEEQVELNCVNRRV